MADPQRVRSIFLDAVEHHPPDQWSAFLDRACGDDPDLRQRIEVLLRAHEQANSILDVAAVPPVVTIDQPAAETAGTVIGPYKLLEQIGEGGMGTVWMAQQTEPVKRLVAVKLVKAGMDSKQVIARFEAERQALALMDHPNIARVLDGGATSASRPFFVMDLVKGVTITKYCDEHHLTPRQRLELFIPICQAVQHAHQKGIIHRDLKPSNVLVALYDGKPVPKVIDFGVAKAAGQPLTEKTLVTGFGNIVGTLEYMSPEQAEVNQLDIDTRSDIYSLGVLLYELLAGSPPFTRKDLEKAGMLEMLRVIREQEPSKPSTKLSTAEGLPTLAANRGTEPAKLTKLVRGELDWIVMKALEKDRNRRYETANGFAMDVQRYLADEPVQACPPSAGYRLRKFARRNKTALAIVGLILFFIALLGGGGGWVIRDRAAREEAFTKERLDRQRRLTDQVTLILDDVNRLEREKKWPEALAAAERAEAALAGGETDDAIRRRVLEALHDLAFVARLDRIRQDRAISIEGKFNNRRTAQDYARAFREYGVDVEQLPAETAIAALRAWPALAAPFAAALDAWVNVRRLLGEDEPNWKLLVAIARGLDPDPLRDRLRAMWGQPVTPKSRAELRQLTESIDVKTQSPATLDVLAETLFNVDLPDSAFQILRDGQYAYPADFWLNTTLGFKLFSRENRADALRFCTAAVSIRPNSTMAHCNLGNALYDQKKLDEAVAEFRKAIVLDPKFAMAHYDLGTVLSDQGKQDEAVAECRKAVELDPKDPRAHCNLGGALGRLGKLDEAFAECRKAVALDPNYAWAHNTLGLALKDLGKLDEALAECRKAIELDPKLAKAHDTLGFLLAHEGKLDEGVAEFRKAIVLDPKIAGAHCNLGNVLMDLGKLDESAAEYRKAIELDPKLALAHYNLGNALYDQKKLDEAAAEYRKAIELDPKYALAHYNLGLVLADQGKLDEAAAEYRKAIELDPKHALAHNNLGVVLADQGKLDEAVVEYRKAIALDPKDPLTHCNLGRALRQQGEFHKALEELRRGHELGSKNPNWSYPSAEMVRQCERLIELDGKLPGLLDGKITPANANERIELAEFCSLKRLHQAAARFYEDAFAGPPESAAKLLAAHRYNAACAVALAGCGQGKDADKLDEKEKARLRGQALVWLRADLETLGRPPDKGADQVRSAAGVRNTLRHWLVDTDLAGVRGPEALAKFPEAERQPWEKLWDDVAEVLKRAQGNTAPEKKAN
jgi:tetratricopeptide (TPR) repeat protein/serine/threonine protein kinase